MIIVLCYIVYILQYRAHLIQTGERRRPIVGLADDDNALHATPMPNQDFFVYRLHKDDRVDVMSEYIRKKNVIVHKIIKKSHESSKFNSFKAVVVLGDSNRVVDAQLWPHGIYIRTWREDRYRHDNHGQFNRKQEDVDAGPVAVGTSNNENHSGDTHTS